MKQINLICIIAAAMLISVSYKGYAQVSHFDTVTVIASSPNYDYQNPKFTISPNSGVGGENRIVYEVHSGNASALAWRSAGFYGYSAEGFVVNDGFMNINAAVEGDMLVWQSNKNGNWDLYYSMWSGSNWSQPARIDTGLTNERKPSLYYSSYYTPTYYLAFERENDVWFRYYRFNTWQGDTNLTGPITNDCSSPVFYGMRVYYLQKTGTDFSLLTRQLFGITYPSYQFVWYPVDSLPKQNTVRNIHTSGEFHFEYDTLGEIYSYMVTNHYTKACKNMTLGFSGNKMNCEGATLSVPVGESTQNDFWPYSVFVFQRRTADSNMIVAQSRTDNGIFTTKYFDLGDTASASRTGVSEPIRNGWTLYKIRAAWEKKINGRMALVETFDTQIITDILSEHESGAKEYELMQNYPNPFNSTSNLKFEIANLRDVKIVIYDVMGREVRTLVSGKMRAGRHVVRFDGSGLPSGVYYYALNVEGKVVQVRKMVMIK